MKTLDCIKTRRSRRKFLDKEIEQYKINKIIEAGIQAPSSQDCQPWHFIIIKNKEIKEKLANIKEEDNREHILTAPICIMVCIDKEKSPSRYIEDGVCATENMLLSAHDLSLGSVYVTGSKLSEPERAEKIRKLLNIPQNIEPITILPVGYPDPSEKLKKKDLIDKKERIHLEKW